MQFLVGCLFLGAFTAFANGETCSGIMNCLKLAGDVQRAAESGNVQAQCPIQKQMVDCFSSALADCQTSGSSPPQETLGQFEMSLSEARTNYDKLCSGSEGKTGAGDGSMTYNPGSEGSIPETASCMEATKCIFDVTTMQNAVQENRMGEACAMLTPSAKCLRSAYNDCQTKNLLPADQLQAMSDQLAKVDTQLGQFCKEGMSVSVGSGSGNTQTVSCADAITCTPDSDKLMDAITNGRHEEACEMITKSHNCLKAAVADCKASNLISGEVLETMEQSYKAYEPQIAQYCQSQKGDVHCMDSASCMLDTDKLVAAINNNRFQEACQLLTTSTTCLDSAVADCKARGIMSEEQVKSMEDLKKSYEPQIQQMCQTGAPEGVSCFQMQTCMPDAATAARFNKSIENHQYEEACKLMAPAMKCQRSALDDCKKRGVLDSAALKEVEESVAMAQVEMKKYCSAGTTASMSIFHIFMAALLVLLINRMTSRT